MRRFAVLPFLLFALACADTPTDVTPDGLTLAADQGDRVVLTVSAGARADMSSFLGGGIIPEGSYGGWAMTARMTESGSVAGNFHVNYMSLNEIVIDFEVTCLAVVGNTAYVGMDQVRRRRGNEKLDSFIGHAFITRLIDNGEGRGAEPDETHDAIQLAWVRAWSGLPDGDCTHPEIQAVLDQDAEDFQVSFKLGRGNVQIIDKR